MLKEAEVQEAES